VRFVAHPQCSWDWLLRLALSCRGHETRRPCFGVPFFFPRFPVGPPKGGFLKDLFFPPGTSCFSGRFFFYSFLFSSSCCCFFSLTSFRGAGIPPSFFSPFLPPGGAAARRLPGFPHARTPRPFFFFGRAVPASPLRQRARPPPPLFFGVDRPLALLGLGPLFSGALADPLAVVGSAELCRVWVSIPSSAGPPSGSPTASR